MVLARVRSDLVGTFGSRTAQRQFVTDGRLGWQVGGRALSYISIRRGRPSAPIWKGPRHNKHTPSGGRAPSHALD
jgi:hypothetical protein